MIQTKFDAFVSAKRPIQIQVPWIRMQAEFDKRSFVVKPKQDRFARWCGFECYEYLVLTDAKQCERDGAVFHLAPSASVPIVYGLDFGWSGWKGSKYPEQHLTYRPYAYSGSDRGMFDWDGKMPHAHIPSTMQMIQLHDAIRDSAPLVKVELPETVLRVPLYGVASQYVFAFSSEVLGLIEQQLKSEEAVLRKKEQEIANTREALVAYADSVRALIE